MKNNFPKPDKYCFQTSILYTFLYKGLLSMVHKHLVLWGWVSYLLMYPWFKLLMPMLIVYNCYSCSNAECIFSTHSFLGRICAECLSIDKKYIWFKREEKNKKPIRIAVVQFIPLPITVVDNWFTIIPIVLTREYMWQHWEWLFPLVVFKDPFL